MEVGIEMVISTRKIIKKYMVFVSLVKKENKWEKFSFFCFYTNALQSEGEMQVINITLLFFHKIRQKVFNLPLEWKCVEHEQCI